jgi:hypothetical protein
MAIPGLDAVFIGKAITEEKLRPFHGRYSYRRVRLRSNQ